MYKSRVETFNQVLYFHHLIFSLFILQDDDMKSKVQYFTCVPKQKYGGGRGKGRTVLRVCGDTRSTSSRSAELRSPF